jgi:hypothetical protein
MTPEQAEKYFKSLFATHLTDDRVRINGISFSREFANSIIKQEKVCFKVKKTKGGEHCIVVEKK